MTLGYASPLIARWSVSKESMLRSSSPFTKPGLRNPNIVIRTKTLHGPLRSLSTPQSPKPTIELSRSLSKLGIELRDYVFPPGCHACDDRLSSRSEPQLCYRCSLALEDHWYPQCLKCAEPVETGCRCTKQPAPFTELIARCVDTGPAAALLRRAKDRHQEEVIRTMADLMVQDSRIDTYLSKSTALVAVPSSLPNRIRRGFALGEELASRLSNSTGVPMHENLLKRRSFRSQRRRKRREDRLASSNDFYTSRGAPHGVIGLIDDIAVTNQTVKSASKALITAGAREVWVWTFSKRLNTKTTEALTKE